jgi:hypothetical protein
MIGIQFRSCGRCAAFIFRAAPGAVVTRRKEVSRNADSKIGLHKSRSTSMPVENEELLACDGCGASIYPEHIRNGAANRVAGKMLCAHCQTERHAPQSHNAHNDGHAAHPPGAGAHHEHPHAPTHSFQRALLGEGHGATRCRTFHCRLNDTSIHMMNDQINEWADHHGDVEIKFASSSIGTVEGKHSEPHLFVTVFF